MYAKVMPADKNTTFIISRLLYEKHIYNALDDAMRDAWGVHRFFCEIEDGCRLCIGVFSRKDNTLLGCAHGMIYPHNMMAHLFVKRGVDGAVATQMCMDECRKYYKRKHIPLYSFSAEVADNNRAIKIMLKKLGYEDKGILKDEFFVSYGIKIPCRFFRKEIK